MTYEELLTHFEVKKRNKDSAQCICPAHEDKEASLTISRGSNGSLIFCHAKCMTAKVLGAVGLTYKDLYDNENDTVWMKYVENKTGHNIECVYHYKNLQGQYMFTRLRLSGKEFKYGILNNNRFTFGLAGKHRNEIPAVYCPYMKQFKDAVANGETVFFCEGEKDVNTLCQQGYKAFTCGASGDWLPVYAELVRGADLVVLADNDEPGHDLAAEVVRDVTGIAKSVKVITPTPDTDKGDVSDYFEKHDKEDFNVLIAGAGEELPEPKTEAVTTVTINDGKVVPAKKVPKLKYVNARELFSTKLPVLFYAVVGLLCEGLNLLAAPPKSGKSWMCLMIALCVAAGKMFLNFATNKADVVYFALEDGDKFEQDRLRKYCENAEAVPDNFHLIFENWVPLDDGFMEQLDQTLNTFPNTKLIIIDTLAKIQSRQKKNESAYERDYRTGQMLKSWADKHGICVLAVTHTTKLVHTEDALANVSGTNGVTGVADAVIVIAKNKRTDTDAVLAIDGRRVRQAEHEIKINWDTCRWEYVGVADPDERERRQRERELEELRSSTAYKAALLLAGRNVDGWKGKARKLIDDASEYGVFVTETPKEVGGMLTNNIAQFAQDGVRVEVIKNGNGGNIYRLSAWQSADIDFEVV